MTFTRHRPQLAWPTQAVVTAMRDRRATSNTDSPAAHGMRAPLGRNVTEGMARPRARSCFGAELADELPLAGRDRLDREAAASAQQHHVGERGRRPQLGER